MFKKIPALILLLFTGAPNSVLGADYSRYVERVYDEMMPAPRAQSYAAAIEKSAGCQSCHSKTDSMTMHENPGVILGCTDCHGGNASVFALQDLGLCRFDLLRFYFNAIS